MARILIAKPVPTFAKYAPGYEFETGETIRGWRCLRRPFRVVSDVKRFEGVRGDASCNSAF
jgi:hypothetical protein